MLDKFRVAVPPALAPASTLAVHVSLLDLEGEAQVVLLRGKVRHIYSFRLRLGWALLDESAGVSEHEQESEALLRGHVNVPDFACDDGAGACEIDVTFDTVVDDSRGPQCTESVLSFLRKSDVGLHVAVRDKLRTFESEFGQLKIVA